MVIEIIESFQHCTIEIIQRTICIKIGPRETYRDNDYYLREIDGIL
jgi:hypothetical protein